MDDENGLELSLGLSLGGSSGKSKAKDASPDPKVEESSNKGSAGASDPRFAHFFQTNAENLEHTGKQKHDLVTQPYGNFWREAGNSSTPMIGESQSQVSRYQDMWMSNNKGNSPEDEKSSINKRRLPSEDASFQAKHPRVNDPMEALVKAPDGAAKNEPISISTDDGSTGENEDVAESEAEGSNSWLVAQREDSAKGSVINRATEKQGSIDQVRISLKGQKQPSFSGSEASSGKVAYVPPLSLQAANEKTVQYPVSVHVPGAPSIITNATTFSSPPVVQLRPTASNERPPVQVMNGTNSQVAFGYSTVQLPTLESSSTWAFGARPQILSSFGGKGDGPVDQHAEDDKKKSQGSLKANGKNVGEASASSSARAEDEKQGENTNFRQNEGVNQSAKESFTALMGSAIKRGIAPNVKFGGTGTYPDLPWVSTTAPGPNGKTISGVTYKCGTNQLKIVCACHGIHMSPEEFVQHASTDGPNQENSQTLPAFPAGNQAASAQN